MKTTILSHSSVLAGAAATLAVAAMGFAGTAQARDNLSWSVGVGVPGAVVNVGNVGSVYPQPIYVQPQPVYVQPQPVYVQPAPRYYPQRPVIVAPAPVYLAPEPIYYERRHRRHGHHGHRDGGRHFQGNAYNQGYGPGYGPVYGPNYGPNYGPSYGPGYGQVYYQQDRRDGYRHDGRR